MNTGPYSPTLTVVDVNCLPSTSLQVSVSLQGYPLWPGYNISKFLLNLRKSSSETPLKCVYIPVVDSGQMQHESYVLNYSLLLNDTIQHCSSLFLISARAFSPNYGLSMPTVETEAKITKCKSKHSTIKIKINHYCTCLRFGYVNFILKLQEIFQITQ